MLCIQLSIGMLNDWVDAARDAAEKPGKPIPAGLATRREALWLAAAFGPAGLLLSVPSGIGALALIAAGLALGYIYDLRLSRTPWSWLPLALALPIVPLHAWLGATGGLPAAMAPLYVAAVLAGAALALANGLVDLERDTRSGRATIGVTLGFDRAWLAHAAILAGLAIAAALLAPVAAGIGPAPVPVPEAPAGSAGLFGPDVLRGLRTWGVGVGIVALGAGAAALRARRPAVRERGWELEAVGVGAVGLGWLAGIAASVSATASGAD